MPSRKTIEKRRAKTAKSFKAGEPSKYEKKRGIKITFASSKDDDSELYIKDH